MSFLFLNIILLLIIAFLLVILSMVWPPDSPWAPWWRTNKKIARAACKLANINSKDTVYDLGSGDGTFLMVAAKEFGAKGVGIEIDPLRHFISKIRVAFNNLNSEIKLINKNFFDINLSEASVIFVYLVPKALERLRPKLLKELKPETRVVSVKYKINLPLVAEEKENNLFLYKIK